MSGGGMSEGGVTAIEEALRIHPTWINGGGALPGPGGSVIAAAMAVASGLCRHVLCFRTVWESTFGVLAAQAAQAARANGGGGGPRPLRRHVRRQLDRPERHAVHASLRRSPRNARDDCGQRAAERRAEPQRHL